MAKLFLTRTHLWDPNTPAPDHNIKINDVSESDYSLARRVVDLKLLTLDGSGNIRPNDPLMRRDLAGMGMQLHAATICPSTTNSNQNIASGQSPSDQSTITNPSSQTNSSQTTSGQTTSGQTTSGQNTSDQTVVHTTSGQVVMTANNTLPLGIAITHSGNGDCRSLPLINTRSHGVGVYGFSGYMPSAPSSTIYDWSLQNATTNEIVAGSGACLASTSLMSTGAWIATLYASTADGTSSSLAYGQLGIDSPTSTSTITLFLDGRSSMPSVGQTYVLGTVISGGTAPYQWSWDYGDGTYSADGTGTHVYTSTGTYTVKVTVRDAGGRVAIAGMVVSVVANNDLDGDGIPNDQDACPLASGNASNNGCPVISGEIPVTADSQTKEFASLLSNNACLIANDQSTGFILAEIPQPPYAFSILDAIRPCDIFFPAILSLTDHTIIARGAIFQTK